MKRMRMALLSIDPWLTRGDFRPFNYSARKIQAALISAPGLDGLEIRIFDFYEKDEVRMCGEIERFDPDIIGASAYVWSLPSLVGVARRLKQNRADRIVIFGGPSARPEMLSLRPFQDSTAFVDALVIGDGEETVVELVALAGASRGDEFAAVPGIAVPTQGRWRRTPERARIMDLDRLASPYQLGLVDKNWTAHLETFRGCPMSCSYCQWGILGRETPVFSKEYLVRELQAYRAAGAKGVYYVDAGINLNAKAFRNLKAAEEEVGLLRESPFFCEAYPTSLTREHVEFFSGIKQISLGIGIQSFDTRLLKEFNRPFDPARVGPLLRDLSRVSRLQLQIIMGLPGDTPSLSARHSTGRVAMGARSSSPIV